MDSLPPELLEECVLSRMDVATLLRLQQTSRGMHRVVYDYLRVHIEAKKRVTMALRTLAAVVRRDRSRRFHYVFEGVFHHWFFHTRLDGHTVWTLPEPEELVAKHPRPRGHARWWCHTGGGTRRCEHA